MNLLSNEGLISTAKRLEEIRKILRISQTRIAQRINRSQSYLSKKAIAGKAPLQTEISEIANFLHSLVAVSGAVSTDNIPSLKKELHDMFLSTKTKPGTLSQKKMVLSGKSFLLDNITITNSDNAIHLSLRMFCVEDSDLQSTITATCSATECVLKVVDHKKHLHLDILADDLTAIKELVKNILQLNLLDLNIDEITFLYQNPPSKTKI